METATILKETWMKVLEYATSPKHGTLSRQQRKGVSIRINDDVYEEGVLFLGDTFIRVTETKSKKTSNTYYDWDAVGSIRTVSTLE